MTGTSRVALAGGLATLLVALTLRPLLQGVGWYLEVVVAVAAVVGTGTALRRWTAHFEIVAAGQVLALLVVLTWLFARPDALLGLLPGPSSVSRLVDLGRVGVQTVAEVAPPAVAVDGLRLLTAAGLGAVALAVDLLAVGLRRPAMAGLPLLTVYCVPAALVPGGLAWWWFALAGGGFLLLVASDSGERVARWGRVLSGQGGQHAPMAATGRRVGALALGVAVLVPTLVPGLDGVTLGRGTGPGGGGTITVGNPILDLRDDLAADEDVDVIRYRTNAERPEPLRIVTVDTFDGDTWRPTTGTLPRSQEASGDLPPPPGLSPSTPVTQLRTRIDVVGDLEETYLPLPYPPTRIDVLGPWLYEAESLNVVGDGVRTSQGLGYDVFHLGVTPDARALADSRTPPREVVERWTQLPDGVPDSVVETARQVAGQGSLYERAVALQDWFRSNGGFEYTVQAPGDNGSGAIAEFLERRSGFCVHFASAMAVMARSLGIPARVAVGFLPGELQEDGDWLITVRDAHAWPELYFPAYGWVRFEPTPPTRTGPAPAWAVPPPDVAPAPAPTALPSATQAVDPEAARDALERDAAAQDLDLAALLARVPWRAVGAAALLLVLALTPAAVAAAVRRVRWRRARGPVTRAEVAWRTLRELVVDLRLPWSAADTPRQQEEHIAALLHPAGRTAGRGRSAGVSRRAPAREAAAREALHRLSRAVERARYAATPGNDAGLEHDVATVVHALAAPLPWRRRAGARLFPASGAEHLRSGAAEGALALDRWERRVAERLGQPARRVAERFGR